MGLVHRHPAAGRVGRAGVKRLGFSGTHSSGELEAQCTNSPLGEGYHVDRGI